MESPTTTTETLRRIVHEFSHGFDKRDLARFTAVWDPAAVWVVAPGYVADGIDAIRATAEQSWSDMKQTHHWNFNEVFDVDGDRATGTIDVQALAQDQSGNWHLSAATYNDTYGRVDGTWVIARREGSIHATLALGSFGAEHPWGDIAEG